MNCDKCGESRELFTMRERDDGSWYEIKDGTLPGHNDLEVCADCADELENATEERNEMTEETLKKGEIYDWKAMQFLGWTAGDGSSTEGYNVEYYFNNGRYLGPDEHGIEPLLVSKNRERV